MEAGNATGKTLKFSHLFPSPSWAILLWGKRALKKMGTGEGEAWKFTVEDFS